MLEAEVARYTRAREKRPGWLLRKRPGRAPTSRRHLCCLLLTRIACISNERREKRARSRPGRLP